MIHVRKETNTLYHSTVLDVNVIECINRSINFGFFFQVYENVMQHIVIQEMRKSRNGTNQRTWRTYY